MKKSTFFTLSLLILLSVSSFAQKFNWLRTYTAAPFNNANQYVATSGNQVVVAGLFQNSINFGTTVLTNQPNVVSVYVASYDTTGVLQWAIKGGADATSEEIYGLEMDEDGNIYIMGSFSFGPTTWGNLNLGIQGSSTATFKTESFLVKLNASGTPQWIRGFYNPTVSLSRNSLQNISVADSSIFIQGVYDTDVFVTGSSLSLTQSAGLFVSNLFVSKLDLNGNLQRIDEIVSTSSSVGANVTDFKAINDSSFYLAGNFDDSVIFGSNASTFSNPTSFGSFVITKFTGTNCDWLRSSTSNSSFFSSYNVRLEISSSDDLWFAGQYRNNFQFLGRNYQTPSVSNAEWFFGKLNPGGTLIDMNSFAFSSNNIQDISENKDGDLFILGSFIDSISVDNQRVSSKGSSDLLVVSVNSSFGLNWYQTGGGANSDFGLSLATLDNSTSAYVLSTFSGLAQFGSTFLTGSISTPSSLLFKMGNCANNQTPINFVGDTNLCSGQSVRIIAAPTSTSTFQWLRDSVELAGEVFRDLTVFNSGNYQVLVNSDGCSDTSRVFDIRVDSLPNVSLFLQDTICRSASSFILSGGAPAGGVYAGRGVVSDSIFDPTIAGIGNTTIKYIFANGGCKDSANYTIYVKPSPSVFFAPPSDICINSAPVTLSNAFPSGGVFSGVGIVGNQFDPSLTAGGLVPITYSFSDGGGCTASSTQFIRVDTLETGSLSTFPTLCLNEGAYTLTEGLPAGGIYQGVGISNGIFDPSVAGVGSFVISYVITNQCGSDTAFQTITVETVPVLNFPPLADVCEGASPIPLSSATPTGGVYSGVGVVNSTFDPSISGAGSFTVFYNITAANGCVARDSSTIIVNSLSSITVSNDTSICVGSSAVLTASGGASYSWNNGSTANSIMVNPATTTTYSVTITSASNCSLTDSVLVTVDSLPVAIISGVDTICDGSSATLTASGGTSYLWNTGAMNNSIVISPNATTNYSVTITDGNSCSATASQMVVVNPLPTINFPSLAAVCESSNSIALNLATPAGGTYSGVGVANSTFDPSVSGVGTFTIFYDFTDANGCSVRDSSSITVNSLPSVAVSNDTSVCVGNSTNLIASGGVSYLWSNGSTNNTIVVNPTVTTTYLVTVTNAGSCLATDSVTVTVNSLPTATINGIDTVCAGSSTNLTASGGVTYQWSTGSTATSIAINPNTTTNYTVTVTDGNACSAVTSQAVVVNSIPVINFAVIPDLCQGSSPITLNFASPFGGTYSGTGVVNSIFDPSISGVGTFTIYYEITDSNGCSARDSTTATVNALPLASVTSDTSICAGSTVALTANGGGSYLWSSGSTNNSITVTPNSTTTYLVTVTNVNNCSAINSVTVTLDSLPVLTTSSDTTICVGDSLVLSALSTSSNYTWNTGAISPSITVLPFQTMDYIVTTVNSSNCTVANTITVTVTTGTQINVGNDTTLNNTISTTVTYDAGSGFAGYVWQDGSTNQTLTVNYDLLKAGTSDTIVVLAINAQGCNSLDSAIVFYDFPTSITEPATFEEGLIIYPNPSNGFVNLKWNKLMNIEMIQFFGIQGKLVKNILIDSQLKNFKINTDGLEKGLYYISVKIVGKESGEWNKIIVQ